MAAWTNARQRRTDAPDDNELCRSLACGLAIVGPEPFETTMDGLPRSPRSLIINNCDNGVLCMPNLQMVRHEHVGKCQEGNKKLMCSVPFQTQVLAQQNEFQQLLGDIYEKPREFGARVAEKRRRMGSETSNLRGSPKPKPSPIQKPDLERTEIYDIVCNIGKGQFSFVYKCRRRSDGDFFALKHVDLNVTGDDRLRNFNTDTSSPTTVSDLKPNPNRTKNESATTKDRRIDLCLREVALLKDLVHDNIVSYVDCVFRAGNLMMILEWADGGDLKSYLRRLRRENSHISAPAFWPTVWQLILAVKFMHQHRIIHRDIKPGNVFLTTAGVVKLGDLGLSRFLGLEELHAFSRVGTPLYMAPEVLRGEGYDFSSDLWSLGCVVFEMLEFCPPMHRPNITFYKLLLKILAGERKSFRCLPTFSDYDDDARHLVEHVVSNLLQVDVQQRMGIEALQNAVRDTALSFADDSGRVLATLDEYSTPKLKISRTSNSPEKHPSRRRAQRLRNLHRLDRSAVLEAAPQELTPDRNRRPRVAAQTHKRRHFDDYDAEKNLGAAAATSEPELKKKTHDPPCSFADADTPLAGGVLKPSHAQPQRFFPHDGNLNGNLNGRKQFCGVAEERRDRERDLRANVETKVAASAEVDDVSPKLDVWPTCARSPCKEPNPIFTQLPRSLHANHHGAYVPTSDAEESHDAVEYESSCDSARLIG